MKPKNEVDNELLKNILVAIKDHEEGRSVSWDPEKYTPSPRRKKG